VGKGVFIFQEPCPSWASHLFFYFAFARAGQAVLFFISPLPDVGKPFIFSFCLCPRRASRLFFHFTFARGGQAILFFISPLPAVGMPFVFSVRLCPRWASLCFSLNTTNICLLCFTANGFAIFFAQDAVFRFRFAHIQAIASDKRRNFCSLTHESSRIITTQEPVGAPFY